MLTKKPHVLQFKAYIETVSLKIDPFWNRQWPWRGTKREWRKACMEILKMPSCALSAWRGLKSVRRGSSVTFRRRRWESKRKQKKKNGSSTIQQAVLGRIQGCCVHSNHPIIPKLSHHSNRHLCSLQDSHSWTCHSNVNNSLAADMRIKTDSVNRCTFWDNTLTHI